VCRFVAYLGPPVTLEALLLAPEHSLLRQSWAPRHQRHGTVNADGFGVGWYDSVRRPEPARYRTARPMWADRSFTSMAGVVASGAVLAAVRSATPPAPVEESGAPPFTSGRWLFAHNGAVDGFHGEPGLELRRQVSERARAGIEGASDAEVLFALVLDRLDAGDSMGEALVGVAMVVEDITTARLNLVLTDGGRVVATAIGDSLFVRRGVGVVVASEPFDDDSCWQPVADRSLVEACAGDVVITSIEKAASGDKS
jgi:gamma-glutamyl hercynylcysteine S-oxide hydrolase